MRILPPPPRSPDHDGRGGSCTAAHSGGGGRQRCGRHVVDDGHTIFIIQARGFSVEGRRGARICGLVRAAQPPSCGAVLGALPNASVRVRGFGRQVLAFLRAGSASERGAELSSTSGMHAPERPHALLTHSLLWQATSQAHRTANALCKALEQV